MRYLVTGLLAALIAGCGSTPPAQPAPTAAIDPYSGSGGKFFGTPSFPAKFDAQKFASFAVGTTTKSQVAATLGKPAGWVTRPDGTSQFEYAYAGSSASVGTQQMQQIVYAFFTFDSNRFLTKMDYPGHAK